MRVNILLTSGKHFHGLIISLRGNMYAHKTSFSPVMFYWSACTQPGKWAIMYLYVEEIYFAIFYHFSIGFWNCSDSMVFSCFHFTRYPSLCKLSRWMMRLEIKWQANRIICNWHRPNSTYKYAENKYLLLKQSINNYSGIMTYHL